MDENKGSGFLLGLLIGSLVGAAVAVLMTPATGEEARKFLKDKAFDPAKAKVVDLSGEVRARAGEIAEEVKSKASDLAKDIKGKAEEIWDKGKKTVAEKKEELLEAFSKNPERKPYS